MPNNVSLVRLTEVSRSFTLEGTKITVLDRVNLAVAEGEALGVVGLSGAGKTTLLQIIGAIDRPTAGTVTYRGEEVFHRTDEQLARFRSRTIGMVFQAHMLLPEFTALENVALAAMVAGVARNEALGRAADLLTRVGLTEREAHRPGKLSGGEQQRVAIARALINKPDLLLADEPTGNLDTKTGERIFDLLRELNQEGGGALVMVTHNRQLAERLEKRIEIRDGSIVDLAGHVIE